MTKFVAYLFEDQIEHDAAALLAEYAARGVVIAPPIPIEDILEKHLKLGIELTTPTACSTYRAIPSATPTSLVRSSSTNAGS
jgi:hypothetical protein